MAYLDKSKLIILVTGTTIEPWDQNWKECEATWIPELRKLGYTVMVAIGNPDLDTHYVISNNIIYFKADDTKRGLFDKSIRLPIKWILQQTNYEYYFRIDSDSFVAPKRFDRMMLENFLENAQINYMGCSHPANFINPHLHKKFFVCNPGTFASGCGYFVSKQAMIIADAKMRIDEDVDYEIDDWVLGRAMWENGVQLLHDSRILFESNYNKLAADPDNIGLPDIANPESHLALQHYMNGHMKDAMVKLGYKILG
jgi:hypothetical protein